MLTECAESDLRGCQDDAVPMASVMNDRATRTVCAVVR